MNEVEVLRTIIEWSVGDTKCANHATLRSVLERYANSKGSDQQKRIAELENKVLELSTKKSELLRENDALKAHVDRLWDALKQVLGRRELTNARRGGYNMGFLSACGWPEPCAEDMQSPAFLEELNEYLKDE